MIALLWDNHVLVVIRLSLDHSSCGLIIFRRFANADSTWGCDAIIACTIFDVCVSCGVVVSALVSKSAVLASVLTY